MIPRRLPTTMAGAPRSPLGSLTQLQPVRTRGSRPDGSPRNELGRPVAMAAPLPALPALRLAEAALADRARVVGRRRVQVPNDAFVSVGARLLPPAERRLLLEAPRPADTANDNAAGGTSRASSLLRSVGRDLFLLLLLAVLLASTFLLGRMNAASTVIEVPEPWDNRSVLS